MPGKKPPSAGGLQTKNSISKSISANAATRQSIVSLKKGGESRSVIPKLIPSQKTASGPSASTAINSSKKLSMEDTRKKFARNSNHSSPELTKKAISRTSKSNIGPNSLDNPSVLKLSASASPSNSFDSSVSDSSSCSSVAIMNHSYSTESLDSGSSSTHSLPPLPSDSYELSTEPCYRTGNPASLPSTGDRSRNLLNSSTGANTFRPSGLRMPTPKIGYFDTEKTLVHSSRKFSSSGLQNNLKSNIGTINTAGGNKRKPNMSPSVRPALQSAIPNYDSLSTQATPLSSNPDSKRTSSSKMHPSSGPAELSDTPRKMDHEMSASVNKDPSPITIEDGKESALSGGGNCACSCEIESGSYPVANQKENLINLDDTVGLVELGGQKISSLSMSDEKSYTGGDSELAAQISVPILNNQNCDAEKSLNGSSRKVSPCALKGIPNTAGSARPVVQSADSPLTGAAPLPSNHDSQPLSPSKLHPQLKPAELCQSPSVEMDHELPSSVNKPPSPIIKQVTKESAFCAGGSPVCSDLQSSQIENAICSDDSVDLVELVSQKVLSLSLSEENTCGGGDSEPSEQISDPILNFQISDVELSLNGSLQNNLPKNNIGTNNTDGGDKPIINSESASTGAAATLPSSPSKLHPPSNPAELCETPWIEKDSEMSCSHNKHLSPITREGCKESTVSVGGNSGSSSGTESGSDLRLSQKDNVVSRDETIELVEEVSQKISSISLSEEKTSACGNLDLSANIIQEVNNLCKNNGTGDTAVGDKPDPDILPSVKSAAHTEITVPDSSPPSKQHSLLNPAELEATPKVVKDLEMCSSVNKDLFPIIGNDSKESVLSGGGIYVRSLETESGSDLPRTQKENSVSSDDTGGLVDIVSQISLLALSEENATSEDLEQSKSESLPFTPATMDFDPCPRTLLADKPNQQQFDSES